MVVDALNRQQRTHSPAQIGRPLADYGQYHTALTEYLLFSSHAINVGNALKYAPDRSLFEGSGCFSSMSLKRAEWIIFFLNRMLFEWLRDRWKDQSSSEIVSQKDFKMMN